MLKNRTLSYIVLLYIMTALYSLLYLKFPLRMEGMSFVITILYMFLPLIATLILQVIIYKEPLSAININFKWSNWYLIAALVPLILAFLTFAISLIVPGVSLDPSMAAFFEKMSKGLTPDQLAKAKEQVEPLKNYLMAIAAFQALIFGMTVNTVAAFGEEAGWRGFLLSSLSTKKFYIASVIIGVVWGFWHAPIILQGHNYPDHPVIGVFMMTVWTILLSPFLVYFAKKSGSVIGAAVFHGVLNASAGIPLMYIKGGSDLTVGVTGIAGFAALIILNGALYIYDRYVSKSKIIQQVKN
jgi:membrane protease YdiL (CAAX protease family)